MITLAIGVLVGLFLIVGLYKIGQFVVKAIAVAVPKIVNTIKIAFYVLVGGFFVTSFLFVASFFGFVSIVIM